MSNIFTFIEFDRCLLLALACATQRQCNLYNTYTSDAHNMVEVHALGIVRTAFCTPMSLRILVLLRLAVALIVDSRRTIASGFARRSVSDFVATTRQTLIGSHEFCTRPLPVFHPSFGLRLFLVSRNLMFSKCCSQKHDGTRTKITQHAPLSFRASLKLHSVCSS